MVMVMEYPTQVLPVFCICQLGLGCMVKVSALALNSNFMALRQYLIMEQLINCLDVCYSVIIPAMTHEILIQQF